MNVAIATEMKVTKMKAKFLISLALAGFILASCDRKKPATTAPTPEPVASVTPTEKPAPLPSPTTAPTSEGRSAPEEKLYVIKRFSVTTADGLYGFSPGKQVTFIREEEGDYVVTDGVIEGKAPKDAFSRNFDNARVLSEKNQQLQESAQQKAKEQSQLAKAQQAADSLQAQSDSECKKHAKLKEQIAAMQTQLNDLRRRISSARAERVSKGFPENGGSRRSGGYYYNGAYYDGYRHGVTVSLSTDASQIEALLSAASNMESQLRKLNNN